MAKNYYYIDDATAQGPNTLLAIENESARFGIGATTSIDSISLNGGPLAGFRNLAINGNFDIWQRGTTTTGTVGVDGSAFVSDRWISGVYVPPSNSPSGTFTVSQRVCTSTEFSYFNASFYQRLSTDNINVGTVSFNNLLDNSSASVLAIQNIENAFSVLGKTVTLSFWARASASTKIVSEQQIHSISSPLWTPTICKTFDLTTTWQKFTHTYTMPTYSQVIAAGYDPGTVDTTLTNPTYTPMGEAATLPLVDWIFQVDIKTAWSLAQWRQSGNAYSGSRPSGFEGTEQTLAEMQSMNNSFIANGYYDIAQIQLEPGPVDTPFELRPRTIERRSCERYYQLIPHHTYVTTANSYSIHTVHFHAVTRIPPTTVSWVPGYLSNVTSFSVDSLSSFGARSVMVSAGAGAGHWEGTIYISAEI
jgi:hypothetical protein